MKIKKLGKIKLGEKRILKEIYEKDKIKFLKIKEKNGIKRNS